MEDEYTDYNDEPNYHAYRYNEPDYGDDWYEKDQLED